MKNKESMTIDYLLVLLYVVIVAVCGMSVVYKWDFMVQWVLPFVLIVTVTTIFINYIMFLYKQYKQQNKAEAQKK